MNLIQLTETYKRIESLLALALAKATKGAAAFAVFANSRTVSTAAPIGPAATAQFVTASFALTPASQGGVGHVDLTATCFATGVGGTTAAGDVLKFDLLLDGATVSSATVSVEQESSASHNVASATVIAKVLGLTPGSSHTYGVQVTNVTNGAHTTVIETATVRVNEAL